MLNEPWLEWVLFGVSLGSISIIFAFAAVSAVRRDFQFFPPPDGQSWQHRTFLLLFRLFLYPLAALTFIAFEPVAQSGIALCPRGVERNERLLQARQVLFRNAGSFIATPSSTSAKPGRRTLSCLMRCEKQTLSCECLRSARPFPDFFVPGRLYMHPRCTLGANRLTL